MEDACHHRVHPYLPRDCAHSVPRRVRHPALDAERDCLRSMHDCYLGCDHAVIHYDDTAGVLPSVSVQVASGLGMSGFMSSSRPSLQRVLDPRGMPIVCAMHEAVWR